MDGYSLCGQQFKVSGKHKLNVGHIPVHSGYFWGLLVVGADLGIRLTSDSHSASHGYFGRSFTKDRRAKLLGYLSC